MSFVKGMMIGGLLSAGAIYMYNETTHNKKENDEKREKDSKENGNNIKEFLLE